MTIKYDGKFLQVNSVQYDGHEYEYVDRMAAAVVIAQPTEDTIVLVKQMRPAISEFVWELPAGKVDAGEAPDMTAVRELQEETGYIAVSCRSLFWCFMSPGYSTERMYFLLCECLPTPGPTKFDDGESIETKVVELEEALAMIDSGLITDAKSMLALNWLARQ